MILNRHKHLNEYCSICGGCLNLNKIMKMNNNGDWVHKSCVYSYFKIKGINDSNIDYYFKKYKDYKIQWYKYMLEIPNIYKPMMNIVTFIEYLVSNRRDLINK